MTLRSSSGPDQIISRPGMGVAEPGIYSIPTLARYPELVHGVSTRIAPDGTDWNLSARRGTPENPPDPAVALRNRLKLAASLGIGLDRMAGCQQVHGSEVAVVGEADGGSGMTPGKLSMQGADAMVTATPGLYLMVLAADCPPVFLYDPAVRAVGLAHSGWKGTVGRISARAVERMVHEYGSRPGNVIAAIGPGVGPCCYSVGPEVVEQVEASFSDVWLAPGDRMPVLEARDGVPYFNLSSAILQALVEAGVPTRNIWAGNVCTAHTTNTFYSHRGERGQCGLFGAVLGLRPT